MPEYLAPGVYVEEISAGPKPIEGVSTSTAAFLGPTERGPETPQLVLSWLDYQRRYGGFTESSYLAYAVQGFFENGGKRCFIARVASGTATPAIGVVGNLQVFALGRGGWGNNLYIKTDRATQYNEASAPDLFRLTVMWYRELPDPFVDPTNPANITNKQRREPNELEVYDNLTHKAGASNNVVTVVNAASGLVRLRWDGAPQPVAPMDAPQLLSGLGSAGEEGDALDDADFQGDLRPILSAAQDELGLGRGLVALEQIDEISLLCVPDEVNGALDGNLRAEIRKLALDQCERLKDRFAIFSVEQGMNEIGGLRPPHDSSYGAYYYPWIEVFDPRSNRPKRIPPTGHIAGIYARTDIERGVHKAPANEVVRGSLNLEFPVPKGKQDLLNPRNVNCLRDFRSDGRGIRVWGARTMSSDPEWKYINVRRLFLFVEESIEQGVQWVVFEPNDAPTWARVRRSITDFLDTVWRNGALMGATQEEAFFVKCDRTTMTEDDINNGRLICYVGIAPVRPAEFVIIRISQKTLEATA